MRDWSESHYLALNFYYFSRGEVPEIKDLTKSL